MAKSLVDLVAPFPRNGALILAILALFSIIDASYCMTSSFNNVELSGKFGYYGVHEMMVRQDSWAGKSEAMIEAHLRFQGASVPSAGRVYVFIFPENLDYLAQMFYDYLHAREGCPDFRDPEVLQLSSASVNTTLLLGYESWVYSRPRTEAANRQFEIGQFDFKSVVPYSTKWAVFLTHCATNVGGSVTVNGEVSFVNSYGHLDADQYPILVYNAAIIVPLMSITLCVYVVSMFRYRRSLHKIQWLLPALLVLGLLSSCAKTGLLYVQNRTGHAPSISVLMLVSLFHALFFSASRFAMLIAAHGVGVVYYHTEAPKIAVIASYCVVYLILTALNHFYELLKDPFQVIAPFVLTVLSPAINFACFAWVNHAIAQSLDLATMGRHRFKITLLENLSMIFQVCTILLIIFGAAQLIKMDMSGSKMWPIIWLLDLYSTLVYLGGIVACMVIYRPRSNNRLFRYTDAAQNDDSEHNETKTRVHISALESDIPHRRTASINPGNTINKNKNRYRNGQTNSDSQPLRTVRRKGKGYEEDLSSAAQRTLLLSSGASMRNSSSLSESGQSLP